jgi:hypothetical protein
MEMGSVAVFAAFAATLSGGGQAPAPGAPVGTFPCVSTDGTYTTFNYPGPVTSGLPCNVDTQAVGRAQNVEQQQRYFDIYAWQSFLALMWPTNDGRALQTSLTATGTPRWQYWKESYEVYQTGGQQPAAWGASRPIAPVCSNAAVLDASRPVLYRTNKLVNMRDNMTVADEIDQAFTYPIIDQRGNLVRYEVLINYDEFQYLLTNELYNVDGQIAFAKQARRVEFPRGDNAQRTTGAVELKMAWRVLTPQDPDGRYFQRSAYVANADGSCSDVTVGLVGMHISHKTLKNKQWIWATFEHVDNVATNQLESVKLRNGQTAMLRPSLSNPDCATCPINVLPPKAADGTQPPVQVARVVPIEQSTQQLNREVQAMLAKIDSVFQYYELVGTQWPTDESAVPAAANQFNTSADPAFLQIANKPGGKPHPVYLTNSTMETYLQKGNQPAQFQIQGFPFNETPVFGTESCMGCHYSAGVATDMVVDSNGQTQVIYGPPMSGDFSWLLQLKAQRKTATPPIR